MRKTRRVINNGNESLPTTKFQSRTPRNNQMKNSNPRKNPSRKKKRRIGLTTTTRTPIRTTIDPQNHITMIMTRSITQTRRNMSPDRTTTLIFRRVRNKN